MSSRLKEPGNTPLPSPFPEGWYYIASRQKVLKAKLIQKTWMGENMRLRGFVGFGCSGAGVGGHVTRTPRAA